MNGIAEGPQTTNMLEQILVRQRKHWNLWSRRPKLIDEICAALSVCRGLVVWANLFDLNLNTVLDWIKADPARLAQYTQAEANLAYQLRGEIFAIAENLAAHFHLDEKGKPTPATRSRLQLARIQTSARRAFLRGLPPPVEPPKTKRSPSIPLPRPLGGEDRGEGVSPASQSAIPSPLRLDRGEGQGEVSIPSLNTDALITENSSKSPRPLGGEARGEGVSPASHSAMPFPLRLDGEGKGEVSTAPFSQSTINPSPSTFSPDEEVAPAPTHQSTFHLPQSIIDSALPPKPTWLQLLGLKPKP